jgi:hypothetical protein
VIAANRDCPAKDVDRANAKRTQNLWSFLSGEGLRKRHILFHRLYSLTIQSAAGLETRCEKFQPFSRRKNRPWYKWPLNYYHWMCSIRQNIGLNQKAVRISQIIDFFDEYLPL